MSFSKIPQIALYIVVGISVLVIGFFYFGDSLVDVAAYEAKVEKLNAPDDASANYYMQTAAVEADSTSTDPVSQEVAEGTDTLVVEEEVLPVAEEEVSEPEVIKITFMEKMVDARTSIALVWAYILVFVTLMVAVVFSILQMLTNTKALVRGLIVFVGIALLVGLAYMLGSGETLNILGYEGTDNSDPKVLKMVDMGLISTYFILGMILISILYSEIAKYFK
ncbi:MAG: hypothetical protein K9H49_19985 [Bacteroidales bacterium]|nr:hypothetical protein [Bacteroidales bacterium]MCF8391165.1 hypothetical protein [Bacteroidales bacterium]